jgi:hypothetical protein
MSDMLAQMARLLAWWARKGASVGRYRRIERVGEMVSIGVEVVGAVVVVG